MKRQACLAAACASLLSCTNAGLYALDGSGPGRADRATFEGIVCVPPAAGEVFPTKVLYAIQGGQGVDPSLVAVIRDGLDSIATRFSLPYISFGLLGYHTVATGIVGSFQPAGTLQAALGQYASYQEQGPWSVRAPLRLAKSILSGDMLSSCQGTVARTRYLVVLVVLYPDASCANPIFNPDIDPRCQALASSDPQACSVCELSFVTSEITALMQSRGAGEVQVQPIYVVPNSVADPQVVEQVAAIARSGGTNHIVVTPDRFGAALNGLDYSSFQGQLVLKRLLPFNRNVISRAGQALPDSDGDGLADVDEAALGTDPQNPDTDGDHLMDGVEVRMGLNPLQQDAITACNPLLDTDGDRLNDCEERVLGTDPCMGDTDSDTLPDLVEALAGTNPLQPERTQDTDRDGYTNIDEIQAHTDPLSADIGYRAEYAYNQSIEPADPTPDGRLCYKVRVSNVVLGRTLERPNLPYVPIPAGTNDVYLYFLAGRENEDRGGVSSLVVQPVQLTGDQRNPAGTIPVVPGSFVVGQ